MKTLTKTLLSAAVLAGSVLTVSAPANAQPTYRGDGAYGRYYDDFGRYDQRYYNGEIWRDTRHCTSPRFGRWRFDPVLMRRVFVPYRWAVRRGFLWDCMYAMNRYSAPGAYRY